MPDFLISSLQTGVPLPIVLFVAVAGAVILIFVGHAIWARWRDRRLARTKALASPPGRIRRLVDELGVETEHDVPLVLRGSRRVVKVDAVLRLPASVIIAILAPPQATAIVGVRSGGSVWMLDVQGREVEIPNPGLQIGPVVSAFMRRFPLVRLRGFVVFPDSCRFPPTAPPGAVTVSEFEVEVRRSIAQDGPEADTVSNAWTAMREFVAEMRARDRDARFVA